MTHISNHNANGNANILGSVRRHHKHERAKDPSLPAPVPGGGQVIANGHLKVELQGVNGDTIVYRVWPETVLRFALESISSTCMKPAAVPPAATPGEIVKTAIDTAFGALSDLERFAARVTATAIAAE